MWLVLLSIAVLLTSILLHSIALDELVTRSGTLASRRIDEGRPIKRHTNSTLSLEPELKLLPFMVSWRIS